MILQDPALIFQTHVIGQTLNQFLVPPIENIWVLDLGCETGTVLRQFLDRGWKPQWLHGVDPDAEKIKQARQFSSPAMSFMRGEIENLQFNPHSFTIVSCLKSLFQPRSDAFFKKFAYEVHRVSRPKGLFFVAAPKEFHVKELFQGFDLVVEADVPASAEPSTVYVLSKKGSE